MGLAVYYPTDIRNALIAAEQATTTAGAEGEYLKGYRAALTTIALAFGLTNNGRQPEADNWHPVALPLPR